MKKALLFYKNHTSKILFLCMLCAGLAFRLYPLLTESYIQDEMSTLAFARADYPLISHFIYPLDDRPWFFYLFIKVLYEIYPNPLFLRVVSMCIGLLSICITYHALGKINKNLALLTAFMLFLSLSRIDYSWQIRDMSLLLLTTSFLLLTGISLLKNIVKKGNWKQIQITYLVIPITIGCLTNYIFIVFSMAYLLFLGTSIFYLTKKLSKVLHFFLQISLQLLPLVGVLCWYLFGQMDTADILASNRWIPQATPFTYLSINATLLGLTAYFNEFYQPTSDTFNEVLALNIGMALFFIVTSVFIIKKKFTHITSLLQIFFFGGICIYFFTYLLVFGISSALHMHIILHRTFIRSGTLFLLSFMVGIYLWLMNGVKRKYQRYIIVSLLLTYTLLFFVNFVSYYQIHDIKTTRFTQQGDVIEAIERYYQLGDQIVFFPIHYQFLYIPFYYQHNSKYMFSSKLAYQKMQQFNLEDPVLRNALSQYSGTLPYDTQFDGKILFVEERTIFSDTPQGLPDKNINQNKSFYQEIKTYCVDEPIRIDESANYIIRACWFKPEYQRKK